MTEPITTVEAARAVLGALPMPAGQARPIADLDVPLLTLREQMAQLVARQKVDAAAERLRLLLADPQAASHGKPAPEGEAAEYRHLLYDADADAATRPFIYCWKGVKS